ncbi:MAG TPA: M48 family metalloprotease [Burkholderiales bacterium]|jgi:predicted Zn-dependent protease|nr:M48 family metalloprotease [Burkholderiales bacterium]
MSARRIALVLACAGVATLTACQSGGGFNVNNIDLSAIAKNVGNLKEVKEPEEIQIGGSMAETLLGASPLLDDAELQTYVNDVGMWVAQQSERPGLPWRFGVNSSDHINAFAAPGGYIIVTKGMMKQLRNEAELAGVLGHEISHVTKKHHLNALRKGALVNLLGEGLAASSDKHSELVRQLAGPTKELYARGLDKSDEFEADRVGVVLAARAGYDPYGLPAVLTTLATADPKDNFLSLLYKTHPLPQARLDKLTPGMATLDNLKATQNADRFQKLTRKLKVASN